jgi:hypothetical protein
MILFADVYDVELCELDDPLKIYQKLVAGNPDLARAKVNHPIIKESSGRKLCVGEWESALVEGQWVWVKYGVRLCVYFPTLRLLCIFNILATQVGSYKGESGQPNVANGCLSDHTHPHPANGRNDPY